MQTFEELYDYIKEHEEIRTVTRGDNQEYFCTNFVTGEKINRFQAQYIRFDYDCDDGFTCVFVSTYQEIKDWLRENCSDYSIFICEHCGSMTVHKRGGDYCSYEVQGKEICQGCYEDDVTFCDNCGTAFFRDDDDAVWIGDDSRYCSSQCAERSGWFVCDRCEEWAHEDYGSWVYTDQNTTHQEHWCECCSDNHTFYCANCDECYSEDEFESYDTQEGYVCPSCFENNTSTCNACGNHVITRNLVHDDTQDDTVCRSCFRRRHPPLVTGDIMYGDYCSFGKSSKKYNCKCKQKIYGYHNYPTNNWMKQLLEHEQYPSDLFLGVELELCKGGENSTNASIIRHAIEQTGEKEMSVSHHIWAAHDGSLRDGFELISQPATPAFHLNLNNKGYNWEAGMKTAIDLGYVSHDGGLCGLHFHVNRDYFTVPSAEDNCSVLLSNNSEWLKLFSRRRDYGYCSFATSEETSFINTEFVKNNTPDNLKAKRKINKVKGDMRGHGRAMNFSNTYTIEFRFVRGTLKYSTFVAAVQLITMFCQFANTNLQTCASVNLRSFISLAKKRNYKEFIKYLVERNIAPQSLCNQDLVQEMSEVTIVLDNDNQVNLNVREA